MNFHNPAQPYFQPRANSHFLQQLNNQKVCPLWGDKTLLFSVGKILLVLCPIMLALHLWLASSFNNIHESVQRGESIRRELMESQVKLSAKREQMLVPERVRVVAAEKLALHVPEKEQVTLFK